MQAPEVRYGPPLGSTPRTAKLPAIVVCAGRWSEIGSATVMAWRRWQLSVIALLAAVALATYTWVRWTDGVDAVTERGTRMEVGVTQFPPTERQPLPAVSGATLDGDQLDLASLRGRPVVINIWGSWCAPCRRETPDLVRVAQKTRAWGVHFVGIDTRDNSAAGRAFVRRYQIPYPSLDDQDGQVLAQFAGIVPISAVPSTMVVDGEGRIAARIVGPVDASTLTVLLEELRSTRPALEGS
jgi:thiol-disulfide isomerase/thioredoxin